ncbi:uncharacterized protein SAMN02745885_01011 [Carboxydocella sporoproducens DSM 16521]|uniref:Radical SAM core domain-containing protein n=2 Tax=Carboxydocella TaxID=178898 RepID=A0A1T4NSY7_9FIRM|nr:MULTISPECIES: radical SAM protein [Carboxydocella]AVX20199.1 uncharacterized protein CFE_1004 [Carboxydocella thermautotrophica]SJZ82267.1 uncharacterized protein SAMN02745885_01011 [Carboxydocella sporoproducens DSM 16521]
MYWSKYNLILPLFEGKEYALVNALMGLVDFATAEEGAQLEAAAAGRWEEVGPELLSYLQDRGYILPDATSESLLLADKYGEFQQELATSPTHILLVPTYACNLACTYCFQQGMKEGELVTKEVVDAFFQHISSKFGQEQPRPFITLFGGEPLIASPRQLEIIDYIARQAKTNDFELAAVTNGYDLEQFVPLFQASGVRIKEIQVTIDGPQEVHDARRGTADGRGTFAEIMRGIRAAVAAGFPINFRVVVDKENLPSLLPLVRYLEEQGWLDLSPGQFKTQLGRNYELYDCYARPQHLFNRLEMWAAYAALTKKEPLLQKFHQPDFKGIRYLIENGEMLVPAFDTCPAAKKEWVFDLHGYIYGCTATAGRAEHRLGIFWPEVIYDQEAVRLWQTRNVLTIPECRDCAVAHVCGGGCGAVAWSRTGKVQAPDCRPIKELYTLGLEYYRDKLG